MKFTQKEKNDIQNCCGNPAKELKTYYEIIKSKGWMPYDRIQGKSDGLLGNILEDLIGIRENNVAEADYKGIELKTNNSGSNSPLILFNVGISHPLKANTIIREKYGAPADDFPDKMTLNTRIKLNKPNTFTKGKANHSFQLKLDEVAKKLFIEIMDLSTRKIISTDFYWDLDKIQQAAERKIKDLAFFVGEIDKENKKVKFTKFDLYKNFNFKKFVDELKAGHAYFEFRIGVYKTGKNLGKGHDHGSAFRINQNAIGTIFDTKFISE